MCFTFWLRSGFSHFMNIDSLRFTWSLVAIDMRLVWSTFKITNLFNVKDAVAEGLRARVVYKFLVCKTSCNACYVGKTSRHLSTRVRGHLLSDRPSNVFRHL